MSTPIYDVLQLQLQTRRAFPDTKQESTSEQVRPTDLQALALELKTGALFADGTRQGELVPLADFMRRRMAKAMRTAAGALDGAPETRCAHVIGLDDLCENVERLVNETPELGSGADVIAAERARQIQDEGYAPDGDIGRADELMAAAGCYLAAAAHGPDAWTRPDGSYAAPGGWPWGDRFWKPSEDRIRNLAKGGALMAAAIDASVATMAGAAGDNP